MTPVEIAQGKSFKGLAQYLLHDEKRDGEQSRTSAERVGWVQSFNLDDADGERSWRLMVATANSANALKDAAGIKRGRAVKNTVYHYSLNFNPKDDPSEDIQRKAVIESLAALGLGDHQALAVEHRDKAHRHVHVMVNLIDPTNGMSAASPVKQPNGKKASKLSNSQRKLSSWAAKFERENGLTITEGRLANANQRAQGELVNAKRKPRNVHEREKREATADRRRDYLKRQHDDRAREIQEQSAALKEQSGLEWEALKASYSSEKTAIRAQMSPAMKERSAEIKTLFKPYWADMFKRHRDEVKAFEAGDRTTIGRIWHGAAAFRDRALDGDILGGFVAAFSAENRRNIVLRKHDREREDMGRRLQEQIAQELGKMKWEFDRQFAQARARFTDRCDELKTKQNVSWSEIREAWRQYNSDRAAAFAQAQDRAERVSRRKGMSRGMGRKPS